MTTADRNSATLLKDSIATALACERAFAVYAKPNPLKTEVVQAIAQEGTSIAELVKGIEPGLIEVTVNGEVVPAEYWPRLKPKAGATVNVRTYPQGRTVRKIVAIVIIAVVMWLTQGAGAAWLQGLTGLAAGSTGWSVLSLAISFVGMLAVNALVKPPMPKQGGSQGAGSNDRSNSITGASNAFTPYGVQPCVIGETRFFPPNCAMPYTEMQGDDQYLRMLLDMGPGDVAVTEVSIGEDDISSFTGVEYQIGPDPQLYSNDVFELEVGENLPTDGQVSNPRTTVTAINELNVEVAWPQGLYGATKDGKDVKVSMTFDVMYRLQGDSVWQHLAASAVSISHPAVVKSGNTFICSSSARKLIRCGLRLVVPLSTVPYEVQVQRVTTNWNGADPKAQIGDFGWVSLRSTTYANPCDLVSTKLGLRIKATDQLNGTISTLNCRVQQNIKYWNGAQWLYGHTNNPAWLYLWLLTVCPANPRLMSEARIDIEELKLWGADCDAWGLEYANVIDAATTIFELLLDICAAGKATFTVKDGLYSVVRDVQQTVPVQLFTPRNSWGFAGARVFVDDVHALRCSFINTQAGWQKDERLVYAPGYDATNASKFESLDMRGVITPEAAWRLGSYHLAVAQNRQVSYSFKCDFENLVCQRGDLILVSHPMCNWGIGWGRIKTTNADPATSFTLDEDVTPQPFQNNVVRFRRDDGTTTVVGMTTNSVMTHTSFVFTRASDATYRGFNGQLQYAEANQPRYAYDATGNGLGIQMEQASTNYVRWSELLSDSSWFYTNATIDYTGGVAPDGTTLAMALRDNAVNGQHSMRQTFPANPLTGTGYITVSVFAKALERNNIGLQLAAGANSVTQLFDLVNGTIGGTTVAGTWTAPINTRMEAWQDGWYRVWMTVKADATAGMSMAVSLQNGNNFLPYVGNGGGIIVWGLQAEVGQVMTSYIPTSGIAVTRAADLATMPTTVVGTGTAGIVEFTPYKYNTDGQAPFNIACSINDGTTAYRQHIRYRPANDALEYASVYNNVSAFTQTISTTGAPTSYRVAFSFANADFRVAANGGAVGTVSSTAVPQSNKLQIGHENGQFSFNGYIRYFQWISRAATNAELQSWSSMSYPLDETTLFLTSATSGIKEGDLAIIGTQNQESGRMIVTKIEPSSDLTATITCVDEAPVVYSAGTGTPPGFISTITNRPWCPAPQPPMITGTVTTGTGTGLYGGHFDNGGTGRPGIRLTMRARGSKPVQQPTTVYTEVVGVAAGIATATAQTKVLTGMLGSAAGLASTNAITAQRAAVVGASACVAASNVVVNNKAGVVGQVAALAQAGAQGADAAAVNQVLVETVGSATGAASAAGTTGLRMAVQVFSFGTTTTAMAGDTITSGVGAIACAATATANMSVVTATTGAATNQLATVTGAGENGSTELAAPATSAQYTLSATGVTQDASGIHFVAANNGAFADWVPVAPLALKDNTDYVIQFTVANLTGGTVRVLVYGATTAHLAATASQSANGVYQFLINTNAAGSLVNRIRIQATGGSSTSGSNTYDITFISVREAHQPWPTTGTSVGHNTTNIQGDYTTGGSEQPPSGITTTPLTNESGVALTDPTLGTLTGDIT